MGDEGVAEGAAQVVGRQSFQHFVRDAVGGGQGELQRGVVGDAGAVEVGGRLAGLLGKAADLVAGAVDQGDADAQAAQQGDVEQQIAEVLVLDDGAVQRDDEHLVAEARHIAQDLAQIGQTQHSPLPPWPCSPACRDSRQARWS